MTYSQIISVLAIAAAAAAASMDSMTFFSPLQADLTEKLDDCFSLRTIVVIFGFFYR